MTPEYDLKKRQEVHAGIEHFKAQVETAKAKATGSEPSPITAEYDTQRRPEANSGVEDFRAKLEAAKAQIAASVETEEVAYLELTSSILVAVATKGGGLVNQHFGHAKEFMIYEVDGNKARFIGHRKIDHYCQSGYGEEGTLAKIIETISDCQAVLVSKIGESPKQELRQAGIEAVEVYEVIENAALDFYQQYQQRQQQPTQSDNLQIEGVQA
ncbi:MAG: hypothetical protein F6K36_16225 [Symploca sp. SIO3C6]|nr:hypothetical protein [Symploca sp. SIO3C6]NET05817.1 hypothetical protein [Symploca sp. SIO2B6]